MFEIAVALLFLLVLWAIGRAFLIAVGAEGDCWLAIPVGLAVVGLAANALYFAAGMSVPSIQLVLLTAFVACALLVVRTGLHRLDWWQLTAVCGLFLLLALPAYVGGEQYYAFRGNHWDHLGYINQSLTILSHPYATYERAAPAQFVAVDVLVHGLPLLGMRPAVGLVFALMLPGKSGNLHLLAFLYVTALMSLIFPAACFAWGRIFQGYGQANRGLSLVVVLAAAYVVGFWTQYVFDINAWSHMSAVPMLLGFVFAYARLLQSLTSASPAAVPVLLPNLLVATFLMAGAFLFYPENTVVHLVMLAVGTVVWCGFTRRLPGLRAVTIVATLFTGGLVLSSLPFWEGTVGFVVKQLGPGVGHVPESWGNYFDSYWQGLRASPPADVACPSCPSGIANRVLAVAGMYFLTPDYAAMPVVRFAWMAATMLLASLTIYNLASSLGAPHSMNDMVVFLVAVVIGGLPLVVFYLAHDAIWNAGKMLAFLSPYLFMALCLPLASPVREPAAGVRRSPLVWLSRGAALVLVCSQFAFGAARVWSARDPVGIGYDSATYPSIQVPTMKSAMAWQVDVGSFVACRGVNLARGADPFHLEYLKQKLAYARVPYFSSAPVESEILNGHEMGRQPLIPTDCNATVAGGRQSGWLEASNVPRFTGTIDFVKFDPSPTVAGFGNPDAGGRWTDGPRASITLPALLPERLTMEFDVSNVFAANASQPFRIRAGGQERRVSFPGPGRYSVPFEQVRNGTEIEIFVPAPTSPLSLGQSTDPRALGVAIRRISVSSAVEAR